MPIYTHIWRINEIRNEWGKLYNEELYSLLVLFTIPGIRIKSERLRCP
jgi:hypothetical protein